MKGHIKNSTFRIFMILGAGVAMGLIVVFTWLPRIYPPIKDVHLSPLPLIQNPAEQSPQTSKAPDEVLYASGMATKFWVGEPEGPDNDYIQNRASYWDDQWETHFGGADDPTCRNGYHPCEFTPYENPFYVALPYGERNEDASLKTSAKTIPWYASAIERGAPLLKNRWVEIQYNTATCFGQWEDVGPNEEDDFAYVFGGAAHPINTFGERAGIDLSPALFSCLGLDTNAQVSWRFVDDGEVPAGPWKRIITTRDVSFLGSSE